MPSDSTVSTVVSPGNFSSTLASVCTPVTIVTAMHSYFVGVNAPDSV
jgi:hypothetical protein